MFKRVRWMGMGAVAGLSASAWAQRRLRRTLQEHPTIQAGADAASTAKWVTREVRAALSDGRSAMAEREAGLRAEVAARVDPSSSGRPPVLPAGVRPLLRVVDATSSDSVPNAVRALGGPLPGMAAPQGGAPGERRPLQRPDGPRRRRRP